MTKALTPRAAALRRRIHEFIAERRDAKLAKLKDNDADREKRDAILDAHVPETWLRDAASRVDQLQLATHIVKPLHPDARGTNLHVVPNPLSQAGLVGTHSVAESRVDDVVGNAAALDVFKFLSLEHEGRTLLECALTGDADFVSALDLTADGDAWQRAFAAIVESRVVATSDALAKQVYFPLDRGDYHLLAPLFPSSLVHAAWERMGEDRFGDSARAARDARRARRPHPHGYREYPNLAIRKLGGTKPQNISQRNSDRRGENWLLASLPPSWTTRDVRPLLGVESVFPRFGRQQRVRELTAQLRGFLERTDHNNVAIRRHRARLVRAICDEVLDYSARLQELESGWTTDPQCLLHEAERLWLDPGRARSDDEFATARATGKWKNLVGHRFGNWLNAALVSKALPMSEHEQAQWKGDLLTELGAFGDLLELNDE